MNNFDFLTIPEILYNRGSETKILPLFTIVSTYKREHRAGK